MKRTAPPSSAAEPPLDEAVKRVKVGRIEPMDGVTEAPQNGGAEVNGESQGKLNNVLFEYLFSIVFYVLFIENTD
jgi:hypothetical protein